MKADEIMVIDEWSLAGFVLSYTVIPSVISQIESSVAQ